jgi:hypothetical protein
MPETGLPLSASETAAAPDKLPPSMTLPEPPDFSVAGVGPSDRASFADVEQDSTPEIADSDIDDLVGEVGEREFTASPTLEMPESETPVFDIGEVEGPESETPAFDIGDMGVPEPASQDRIELEAEPLDFSESIPVEMSSPEPEPPQPESIAFEPPPPPVQADPEPLPISGSDLEIDRNFDPEWKTAPVPTPTPEPEPEDNQFDLPSIETFEPEIQAADPEPEPDPIGSAPESEIDQPAEETVRLTDVLEDDTLFADPELDIVKLAAGGVTEIVLPVELGSGADRKRFKLSLNLRLDHVE